MPAGPQHDWNRYFHYIALFLLGHVIAYFTFGGLSPGWAILSAGAFGFGLGVPIGKAEYYTDGYEVMTLVCPPFVCIVGLVLGYVVIRVAFS